MITPAVRRAALLVLSIAALAAVRTVALGADPPPWLSWSGGLATDEGFYTLDARHLALFGTWARGDFHDRLLSPLLSSVQQEVFHLFGASLISARTIDALFGLLTIGLLWVGLRALFGEVSASAGALLLGFAPPFVLYNRLALQETPAVFCLTLSFTLWALAQSHGRAEQPNRVQAALALAGIAAGLALLCKTLAVLFVPALCGMAVRSGRRGAWLAGGFLCILAAYGAFWAGPHQTELARMGAYYQQHQFVPHSWHSLWLNVRRAGVGDRAGSLRGLVPYLFLFVPVPFLLVLTRARRFRAKNAGEQVLWVWLTAGIGFCAVSSYAPDRYYVLFLPPLCGLAGIAFASLGPVPRRAFGLAACAVNLLWLGAAWHGQTWTAQQNAQQLAHLLPVRSVVIGDMAPAVCLSTVLDTAPVQPGLSNSVRPVETLGADYLAVSRVPAVTDWWQVRYPQIVQPTHLLTSLRVGTHRTVDIYQVRP